MYAIKALSVALSLPEVLFELFVDQGLDSVIGRVFLVDIQLEAEAAATLLDDTAAHITGHDDQRVLEVNCPALQNQSSIAQALSAAKKTIGPCEQTCSERRSTLQSSGPKFPILDFSATVKSPEEFILCEWSTFANAWSTYPRNIK